ncbi:MAG: helix-turn-helix transcriptional regulator [Spirochaetales bacterium]|uniref:Helix-turn-helix transcriptional regulator n=1 Tax=Candidatus Thalassospirochaeta sargassi TaxID=3119039 RepID=A0AAJ1ICD0_9SPIO|nr:helix-turn-helix transcriptional regulator [Spirochaetales bacterium]
MDTEEQQRLFKRTIQEMRRGNLVLAVLALLHERKYGYELLKEMNTLGFGLTQDTLYPMLRRLDEQKLIDSEWVVETTRPRKYYCINRNGEVLLENLKSEWKNQMERLERVIK